MDTAFKASLDDLRMLFLLSEAGSISGAMRRFGIPKATLSRALARLEEQAGLPLFDRTSKGLKLTQAGELLRPVAQSATDIGSEAEDIIRRASGEPEGDLRIVASALSGRQILAPVIGAFTARHPKVRVSLDISGLGPDPLEEDLDIVLQLGRPDAPYLIARKIVSSRFRLYCAADMAKRLQHAGPSDIEKLGRIVISVPGYPEDWTVTDAAGQTVTLCSHQICAVADPSVAIEIISAGHGLAFLPVIFCEPHVADGTIGCVLADYTGPQIDLFATFPPKRASIPAVRAFLDLLVDMTRPKNSQDPATRPDFGK